MVTQLVQEVGVQLLLVGLVVPWVILLISPLIAFGGLFFLFTSRLAHFLLGEPEISMEVL